LQFLKNLDDDDDDDDDVYINGTWKRTRRNIKASPTENLGYCVLKQHKPWFDERCSNLLD
jgi:hypothetical protein